MRTLWDYKNHLNDKSKTFPYNNYVEFPKDAGRITSNVILLCAFFSLFSMFLCSVIVIFLKKIPRLAIYITFGINVIGSLILAVELWINFVFLNGEYINSSSLRAVTSKSLANSALTNHVNSKIKETSVLFNSNSSNFLVFTYNITNLFSILTIDGLPELQVIFVPIIITTFFSWTQTSVVINNREKFLNLTQLLKEASYTLLSMPYLLFHLITIFLCLSLFSLYYIMITIFILTVVNPVFYKQGFVDFIVTQRTTVVCLLVVHTISCIWLWFFVTDCGKYLLAHVTCTYIFQHQRRKPSFSNKYLFTLSPVKDLIRYHLGTIAIASAVVLFCEQYKILLHYITTVLKNFGIKTKEINNFFSNNRCKHVHRNAILCVVIYGEGFADSAKHCYSLLNDNASFLLNISERIYLFLLSLKCTVIVATVVFLQCWFGLMLLPHALPHNLPFITWFIVLFALNFAQTVFSVYDAVLNTFIVCYCDDLQRNGVNERPRYVSRRFRNSIYNLYIKERIKAMKSNRK